MRINKRVFKYLRNIRIPNIVMVVFSLLFLYLTFAIANTHANFEMVEVIIVNVYGVLFCVGPILAWLLRWKSLDKNYRQIAVFFYIVFTCLLVMHLRNIVMAIISAEGL